MYLYMYRRGKEQPLLQVHLHKASEASSTCIYWAKYKYTLLVTAEYMYVVTAVKLLHVCIVVDCTYMYTTCAHDIHTCCQ